MKILIMPKDYEQVETNLENIDGIIIGLNGLSINMPAYFEYDEMIKMHDLMKKNNKETFISLNKNMFESDLDYLKEIMVKLDDTKINGIMYYDIAVVNIKKDLKLNRALVWNQEHLTTNYETANFWYDFGAKYTYLSSEITLREIEEIKESAKAKLMVNVFGYLPMFASRRHLVKNYLKTFNIEDESKINYITKEDKTYPIIDNEHGTIAYSHVCLNAIEEVVNMDVDYIVLNSFNIKASAFKNIVFMFNIVSPDNVAEFNDEINELLETNKGFLNKETIYKVKK